MLGLRSTPVVGLPQFDGWSQVATDKRHSWVCSFAVDGDNAGNVGREVMHDLAGANPTSAYDLHSLLSPIIKNVEAKGCHMQLSFLLIAQGRSILAAHNGSIYLSRGTKVGRILVSNTLQIVEGKAKAKDVFVLATQQAKVFLGEVEQKLNQQYDIDTIVTSLVPGVHSADRASCSALAFCEVVERNQLEDPETEATLSSPTPDATHNFSRQTFESNQDESPNRPATNPVVDSSESINPIQDSTLMAENEFTKIRPQSKLKSSLGLGMNLVKGLGNLIKAIFKFLFWTVRVTTLLILSLMGKGTYLETQSLPKRTMILAITATIVVLAGSLFVATKVFQTSKARGIATSRVQEYSSRLETVQQLSQSDPILAREEANTILSELQTIKQEYSSNPVGLKIVNLVLSDAEEIYQQISGKEEVQELPVFYDLRLAEVDFIGNAITLVGDNKAAFLDREKGTVVVLDLNSKQISKLNKGDWSQTIDVVGFGSDRVAVLADSGLFRAKLDGSYRIFKEKEDRLTNANILANFADYLYVLNPSERGIYRYREVIETASSASESASKDESSVTSISWLQSSLPIDWQDITSMSVDADIWLGTNNGQILRLSSRELDESFAVSGLPDKMTSGLVVVALEEDDYLYVLEKDANRLVIFKKTGEFYKEIKSPSFAAVSDFAVSLSDKTIYALSGSVVYKIPLEF